MKKNAAADLFLFRRNTFVKCVNVRGIPAGDDASLEFQGRRQHAVFNCPRFADKFDETWNTVIREVSCSLFNTLEGCLLGFSRIKRLRVLWIKLQFRAETLTIVGINDGNQCNADAVITYRKCLSK